MTRINLEATLTIQKSRERLDQALARAFSDYSRSRLQKWIADGYVKVNGVIITEQRYKVSGGETVVIAAETQSETDWTPEQISLDIIHEDEHILVINKPANMVVHPAAGNYDGTLVNGLLFHRPELSEIPRAGIVHRLDKDTTGLMVVAKTLVAHAKLVDDLKEHLVGRHYECLVYGHMIAGGTVDEPIGRNPRNRKSMAVVANGKPSVTYYRIARKYKDFTLLDISLETGRTHQIRVHMSHLKYPLVGDPVYSPRIRFPAGCSDEFKKELSHFKRQALHARQLSLSHPVTGNALTWQADRPDDFEQLIARLEQEPSQNVG